MFSHRHSKYTIFLLSLQCLPCFQSARGTCERNHNVVTCDRLDDVHLYDTKDWTELVIQPKTNGQATAEFPNSTLTTNFFRMIPFVTSVRIFNQISSLRDDLTTARYFPRPAQRLNHLSLQGNRLSNVDLCFFVHNDNLRVLNLQDNGVETLSEHNCGYAQFKDLDLSFNRISVLQKSALSVLLLETLILRHNRLSAITQGALPQSLKILVLDYNRLVYLGAHFLEYLNSLVVLSVRHNRLTSISESWLHPKSIQNLDLSFNEIEMIDNDKQTEYKKYPREGENMILDLSHNRLSSFSWESPSTTFWLNLDLSHNKLTNMNMSGNVFNQVLFVGIWGNPWNCQCLRKLESKIKYQSECDTGMFGSGKWPICFDSGSCDHLAVARTNFEKFYIAIENVTTEGICGLKRN